jgi:hypothetical protein
MAFDLDPAYKQVPERIADLKATHPDARLRPTDPSKPYWLEEIDGATFIVYSAACYLTPDDPLPGIGMAWEPFPGRTPYTKDSELMNAETSAWGRAIVAALQSESKAIASAEEVRNRQAEDAVGPRERTFSAPKPPSDKQIGFLNSLLGQTGLDLFDLVDVIEREVVTAPDLTGAEAKKVIDHLLAVRDGKVSRPAQPQRRSSAEPPPLDYAPDERPF